MSLYKRSGSPHYWCRFSLGGRRIQQSTGATKRKAAEEYEHRLQGRIWRETRLGERTGNWDQAVKKWFELRTARASTEHRDKEITDWFSLAMGQLPLSSINSDVIDGAKMRLIKDRAPATANRYLAVMRAILRAAVNWGWLQHAPQIQLFPLPQIEPRFITRTQFGKLLEELPAHMKPVAQFAVLTGLRTKNIRELIWSRVNIENAHVWIPAQSTKGGRAIGIALSEDAVKVLKAIKQTKGQERVFLYKGRPVSNAYGKAAWRKACKRAGLTGLRFHDLRHTWASWLMQAGVPAYAIQALGGWASPKMVERYAHLSPEHLKQYAALSRLQACVTLVQK
jgi:integrase